MFDHLLAIQMKAITNKTEKSPVIHFEDWLRLFCLFTTTGGSYYFTLIMYLHLAILRPTFSLEVYSMLEQAKEEEEADSSRETRRLDLISMVD